jgi:hypothetical protein
MSNSSSGSAPTTTTTSLISYEWGGNNLPDLFLAERHYGMVSLKVIQQRSELLLIVGGRQAMLAGTVPRAHLNLASAVALSLFPMT